MEDESFGLSLLKKCQKETKTSLGSHTKSCGSVQATMSRQGGRALSQVVPDLGKLAKRTSLGCGLKCCWSATRPWMIHVGCQNPFSK
nr:hypothetical protein POPTR_003G189000 [Ipomoea batatas]